MKRSTLEWYEQLARGLIWAAGIVLLLALVGAVMIAGSSGSVPLPEEAEREGRGYFALLSLGGGVGLAGLLAGLGAILRLMVTERLEKLGPAPRRDEDEEGDAKLPPLKTARERTRRRPPKPKPEAPRPAPAPRTRRKTDGGDKARDDG